MRNPLNKAMRPQDKGPEPVQAAPVLMTSSLQPIMNQVNEISHTEPGTRENLLKGVAQAQAAQEAAAEAKEAAETEADFDKACDDAIRAREKEMFFRRLLEKLDYTPRMSEEDYTETVDAVDAIVREAAAEYCAIAERLMPELIQAKKKYEQTVKDADKVLTALDASSRYLQIKYRYRKNEYSDGTEDLTEDPNEWLKHTRRYGNGRAADYIFIKARDNNTWPPKEIRNENACAAWYAAERITK